MTVDEYLDALMAACDVVNDSELARALKIRPSRIANYRAGTSKPDEWMIGQIALRLGLTSDEVAADVAGATGPQVSRRAKRSRRTKA